jgi:2TM domain
MTDDAFERAAEREETEHRRRRRERRARAMRAGFRIHLTVYIAVQVLLVAIWALEWALDGTFHHPWFLYALFGWGIGVAAHYAACRDSIRAGRAAPS